jgi:tRNA-guanine family transglycosylase
LAERLAALHNLYFMESLIWEIRQAISAKRLEELKRNGKE